MNKKKSDDTQPESIGETNHEATAQKL